MKTNFPRLLSDRHVSDFHRDGVIILRAFYDCTGEIEPIQTCIHHLIQTLLVKYGLPITHSPFSPAAFDIGYQRLIAHDRRIGGEIYDAVKNIPAFVRLASSVKHDAIVAQLIGTETPGIAHGGYGIRIDNPNEERYRAGWHQDYPAQLRSPEGLVFWSPLKQVTEEMGPVVFCLGSHKDGIVPVYTHDARNLDKAGAYGLTLQNEEHIIARYPHLAPTTEPGDLIVIHYATIHCSGRNSSDRSRWTMQMRYFDFDHPFAAQIGWRGCFASGLRLQDVHPELVLD